MTISYAPENEPINPYRISARAIDESIAMMDFVHERIDRSISIDPDPYGDQLLSIAPVEDGMIVFDMEGTLNEVLEEVEHDG